MEIIEVNTMNAFLANFVTSVSITLLSCSWCQDTCCIWWDKREVERDFLCVHTLWSRWYMSLLFLDYPGCAHGHNLMFRSPDHSIVLTTANLKRLLLTAYHRSHTWPCPHNWHASNDRHRLSVTKQLLALFFSLSVTGDDSGFSTALPIVQILMGHVVDVTWHLDPAS